MVLDRSMSVAGVLLCHNEGLLKGCNHDRKEIATVFYPVSVPSAGPPRWTYLIRKKNGEVEATGKVQA